MLSEVIQRRKGKILYDCTYIRSLKKKSSNIQRYRIKTCFGGREKGYGCEKKMGR
jgi:hypothetical protein